MPIKFYTNSPKTIEKIRDEIYNAFDWASSDEGHEYWSQVVKHLTRYLKAAGQSSECKTEIEELKGRLAELERRCCP